MLNHGDDRSVNGKHWIASKEAADRQTGIDKTKRKENKATQFQRHLTTCLTLYTDTNQSLPSSPFQTPPLMDSKGYHISVSREHPRPGLTITGTYPQANWMRPSFFLYGTVRYSINGLGRPSMRHVSGQARCNTCLARVGSWYIPKRQGGKVGQLREECDTGISGAERTGFFLPLWGSWKEF